MKVLLIGGSGFTGRRTTPLLCSRVPVRALLRPGRPESAFGEAPVEVARGDLDDPSSLETAMRGCQGLVNLASLGFGHGPGLIRSAVKAGIERALFVSTTSIYTQLNPASKQIRQEAEALIKGSPLKWTILRPTMIYGAADDRNMIRLLRLIRRWGVVPVPGPGGAMLQPVHVNDVARAVVQAFFSENTVGGEYNLSGAEPLSMNQVVSLAAKAVDRPVKVVHVPTGLILPLVRFYETISSRPKIKTEQVRRLQEDKAFDHQSAARDFGFDPRGFEEGIIAEAISSGLKGG
jgi:nucleoside-diphosphate-sugar epimerase